MTTDNALRNAHAKLNGLEAELDLLDKKHNSLLNDIAKVKSFIRLHAEFSGSELSGHEVANFRRIRAKNNNANLIVQEVCNILRDRGSPMSRADLVANLEQKGILIRGTNAANVLGTILYRSEGRVVNIKRVGYWLQGEPFPEDTVSPTSTFCEHLPGQHWCERCGCL